MIKRLRTEPRKKEITVEIVCSVCQSPIIPKSEKIVRSDTGLLSKPTFYDVMNCPSCRCQIILKARMLDEHKCENAVAKAAPNEKTAFTIDEWIQRALEAEANRNGWRVRAEALEQAIRSLAAPCAICDTEPSDNPDSPCGLCREGDCAGWALDGRFKEGAV